MEEIQLGSIWAMINSFWQRQPMRRKFHPKEENGLHPGLIVRDNFDGFTYQIAPGTTKTYEGGICVYKVNLHPKKDTHFLMHLSAPVTTDDMEDQKHGWNGVKQLLQWQLQSLLNQYKYCCNSL